MADTLACPLCKTQSTIPLADIGERRYRQCPDCFLAFLSPEQRLDPDAERERYLQHNNDPDDTRYRNFLDRLAKHLTPLLPPDAHGLDYGSGPGPTLSVMLEERGFRMSIYDPYFAPDEAALENTYDFITCTETMEHFYDPAAELQRLDSMLVPGGFLGVMTEMLTAPERFADWWYPRDPTHICFYRRETMEWVAHRFRWTVSFPDKNVTIFRKPHE